MNEFKTTDNLKNIVKDVILNHNMETKGFICKYCGKGFRKESTLAAHMCEPKRRAQQENEAGVVLGMTAYLRFFEITQGSAKFKTYNDFSSSPYYNAFVKFGRHLINIRAINTNKFIDWIIKQNKKLDHWCKDVHYQEYLFEHLRTESVQDAVERTIKTMEDWAAEHDSQFNHYFLYASTNLITQQITTGRISPWVVYNCNSGIACLDKLSPEQIEIVFPYIDTDFWKRKFVDYIADTEWVKHILSEAHL